MPDLGVTLIGVDGDDEGERAWDNLALLHTEAMGRLLRLLDVPHSSYELRAGVLLRGAIDRLSLARKRHDAPGWRRVVGDYHAKVCATRGRPGRLEEWLTRGAVRGLRCDRQELRQQLVRQVRCLRTEEITVLADAVQCVGRAIPYTHLIVTLPLWLIQERVWWPMPADLHTIQRHQVWVVSRKSVPFTAWDLVLTPYTPEDYAYRVHQWEHGYVVEAAGHLETHRLIGDLSFLFPDGFQVHNQQIGLPGELLPLSETIEWPDNVRPLGRFTEWDPSLTPEMALDQAYELVRAWFGVPRSRLGVDGAHG